MDESVELTSGEATDTERREERSLRPLSLDEYIGQTSLKQNLAVFLQAARERSEPLDHTLFYGPPGLGKTTLAQILAREMGVQIRLTAGPSIEKAGDLAALLTNLEAGDVLFIDEIHRLGRNLEEVLYPAMEDFALDLVVGNGPAARSVRLDLPRFTLVGATTRVGLLSPPLRDRFGIVEHLSYYNEAELHRIATRSASILSCSIDPSGAAEIARRSRGTPRIVNRLLKRVRDFAQVAGSRTIDEPVALDALVRMRVDRFGLDEIDRRILRTILHKFNGGPVGLATLAAATGEDSGTIEEIYEPYLMQIGFLDRTPRGRRATPAARQHILDESGRGQV
jgi:Holliday junction DNA helicase RuvB